MEENNKKNSSKNINSVLFSTSLVFDQPIDKLWLFLRDRNNDLKTITYFDKLIYIKGDNTWNLGNIFSINWIGLTRLEYKCIYIENNSNRKIIKWKVKGDIGINFYKALYLYRITQNNKTLVKCIISRTDKINELIDFSQSVNYYLDLEYKGLEKKSKYLKDLNEDIISYESCIINTNYIKVWNFIVDIKKMSEISPFMITKIEYYDINFKVGSFAKYYLEKLNLTVFIKIIDIQIPKKGKVWLYKLETVGTNINNLPKITEYKINIINNEKTKLSILHKFSSDTSQEFLNYFKINIKKSKKIYKNFLEKE